MGVVVRAGKWPRPRSWTGCRRSGSARLRHQVYVRASSHPGAADCRTRGAEGVGWPDRRGGSDRPAGPSSRGMLPGAQSSGTCPAGSRSAPVPDAGHPELEVRRSTPDRAAGCDGTAGQPCPSHAGFASGRLTVLRWSPRSQVGRRPAVGSRPGAVRGTSAWGMTASDVEAWGMTASDVEARFLRRSTSPSKVVLLSPEHRHPCPWSGQPVCAVFAGGDLRTVDLPVPVAVHPRGTPTSAVRPSQGNGGCSHGMRQLRATGR